MVSVTINMVVKRGCDFVLLNMIEKLAAANPTSDSSNSRLRLTALGVVSRLPESTPAPYYLIRQPETQVSRTWHENPVLQYSHVTQSQLRVAITIPCDLDAT